MKPLLLEPVFTPRPWGGDALRRVLAKAAPEGTPIGESWELSDHPNGRSKLAESGMLLGDALRADPLAMLGREEAMDRFPVLVKYIDAAEDLSLQVHPSDAWCRTNGHADLGKAECWYIMDCAPHAEVILGLKPGTMPAMLREALRHRAVEPLLNRVPITPGDFIAVPPGTVHAILGGTLLCEIQQSSDTTFRLWDWDRQPPRPLHVEESMQCTRFEAPPPVQHLGAIRARGGSVERGLLANEHFRVTAADVPPGASYTPRSGGLGRGPRIVNVVAGGAEWSDGAAAKRGDTWFLPADIPRMPAMRAGAAGVRLLLTEPILR